MIGRNTSTCAGAVMSIQILMGAAPVAAPTLFGGLEEGGQRGPPVRLLELLDPLSGLAQLAPGLSQFLLQAPLPEGVLGPGDGRLEQSFQLRSLHHPPAGPDERPQVALLDAQ